MGDEVSRDGPVLGFWRCEVESEVSGTDAQLEVNVGDR